MATLITTNGDVIPVERDRALSLQELQSAVGGYIQLLPMDDGKVMVINEEGKLNRLPVNNKATSLMRGRLFPGDMIVGDALICDEDEEGELY